MNQQFNFCSQQKPLTLCLKKMCDTLVMIIRQILTDFHNSFTTGKLVKFSTKQCTTLSTKPNTCCHITLRN